MSDKNFQKVDTKSIQLESLFNFMAYLGYEPARIDRLPAAGKERHKTRNGGWQMFSGVQAKGGNRNISTRTAIHLHNQELSDYEEVKPGWFKPKGTKVDMHLSKYALNVLLAHKLVHQVKFQAANRAIRGIQFQSDMVRFVDPTYATLYGIEG
ncbi:hypothetical protein [Pseudomonas phage vB_PseuGesM_254]|uniref:DUF7390 domain-containing protein n=1 Tax=Pseudomonas phage vB_PseuGesM_254 TaxID=3092638 RepID=A0AAX4G6K8_9CAUD|nr:hypothetical protein [Pseudomonas phage PseuGes_254]